MKCDLFHFQQEAVNDLRNKVALALNNYNEYYVPQVVSLQAPTGSGKTIIMTALIEDIFNGTEKYIAQQNAVFVWLSDSPGLNEQSKQKIEAKADRIKFGQCVMVNEASFDQETFDDGYIYFINTQKISKNANLCSKSDGRQYTIWETLENTVREKADRFYVIIDEAHRGALGAAAGKATSIMQRFIKGNDNPKVSPMPVVIGMSATSERFNMLVSGISTTLHNVIIDASRVRSSGLLKDRILLLHPDDISKYNEMAILENATKEWIDKCKSWENYSVVQHEKKIYPVFVIQVRSATNGNVISDTDLNEVLSRIERVIGNRFNYGEVVHTFGSCGEIEINGLKVPHVEPAEIADDKTIKVVLFKENLSTGWDCPRAETMMSFSTAEDPTYIAQLLGRMVRTPLQRHIEFDESLNDVNLYLPHFNEENCTKVIESLRSSEVNDYPVYIEEKTIEDTTSWASVHAGKRKSHGTDDRQQNIFDVINNTDEKLRKDVLPQSVAPNQNDEQDVDAKNREPGNSKDLETEKSSEPKVDGGYSKPLNTAISSSNNDFIEANNHEEETAKSEGTVVEVNLFTELDRADVMKNIIDFGLLSYSIRPKKIHSYLKSVLMLADLLTDTGIYPGATKIVADGMLQLIHDYIEKLKQEGKYDKLKSDIIDMKMAVHIFDMFGKKVNSYSTTSLFSEYDDILDPQLQVADTRMGGFGLPERYNIKYYDNEYSANYKIDSIMFAFNDDCIKELEEYSKKIFIELKNKYRIHLVRQSDNIIKKYNDIVASADEISERNFRPPERISQDSSGDYYEHHLFADEETELFRANLNSWEVGVLKEEFERNDFVCWIRNVSRASWALCLPYEINGEIKAFYPDFIIVRKDMSGYIFDILEPHGSMYDDNLAKAKSFAKYFNKENRIGRLQIIRKEQNEFKRLEITDTNVQERILRAVTLEEFNNIFKEFSFSDK